MELIEKLPAAERAKIEKLLKTTGNSPMDLEKHLTEQRFSGGRVCPICGGVHVQRNGKRSNGSQKYICKDCGKTFSIRKNTIFGGTRKSLAVWLEYLNCMAERLTLDESAERCGITHSTAFLWRHKILDAMSVSGGDTGLTGIVEADEAFLPISYKGNKKAFENGTAGRNQRERGGENHKRGLSDELVCVPCALDRKGNAISKAAKLGKCSTEAVTSVLAGHLSPDATLCSDEDASYRKFARENGNTLVQIKGGKGSVKGIFHIQHINSYHSQLKSFIRSFKGISSKYLNNYLTWNNMVEYNINSLSEKVGAILKNITSAVFEETCLKVHLRPSLPLLVKNQS